MTEHMPRVALYARVSTTIHGQDPFNQMDIIRAIAGRRGYRIVGEYVDYASGKDGNRPQWQEVMQLARRHEIDVILALRLDRIMRSVSNLCTVIEDLRRYRVALSFSDMDLDPNSPNGMLTINILGSIAQWEREITSARVKEGLARRVEQGVTLGRPSADIPAHKIALMRTQGRTWADIQRELGIPRTTINEHRKEIDAEIASIKAEQ